MVACNDDAMVAIYPDRAREARRPPWPIPSTKSRQ